MTDKQVVKATLDHAEELIENIRAADKAEVEALGLTVRQVAEHSVRQNAYAFLSDGHVVCIFGLDPSSYLSKTANVWLLSSNFMEGNEYFFARSSKRLLHHYMQYYNKLYGHVHARYSDAVIWLNWCGFHIGPVELLGPNDEPFHYFEMVR